MARPVDRKKRKAQQDEICKRMAGGESLNKICKSEGMPRRASVYRWLDDPKEKEFRDNYARAATQRADVIFEEMLDIADNARNDWMETNGADSVGYKLNGEHVQRSRLRIDTRKWILSKMMPKKYGDKIETTHNLADPIAEMLAQVADIGRKIGS